MKNKNKSAIKHLCLTAIFVGICQYGAAQTNVTLTTQADVNAFDSATTEVTGNLSIGIGLSDSDITDLSGLRNLTSIGNGFNIRRNVELTSLSGLDNITSVGGIFRIEDNNRLTSLEGLGRIKSIVIFNIIKNSSLTSFNGLNMLESITNASNPFIIHNNSNLTSLQGLESLSTINNGLTITRNPELITLRGLEALTTFGGRLVIGVNNTDSDPNSKLVNFCAISNLFRSPSLQITESEYDVEYNAYNPTYAEIKSAATCSLAAIALRKIYAYSSTGSGSSGTALTLAELNTIGITGATATNLVAYNVAIKAKTDFTDPATDSEDTLTELQTLITSVNNRPVVGLSEYSSKSLVRLSPNPAIGFVSFSGLSSEEGYVIYNTLGVAVQSGIVFSEEKIMIESLPAGLYFLKLGNLEVFKFLKE